MTTNANAPVETRHRDDATAMLNQTYDRVLTLAQTLANLEAANNRLAEIEQFARDAGIDLSGHTPSPCPGCAAKDEAMAELRADVSAMCQMVKAAMPELMCYYAQDGDTIDTHLSRFIIPPADPVADLATQLRALHQNAKGCPFDLTPADGPIARLAIFMHENGDRVAEALELSRLPLGGAK